MSETETKNRETSEPETKNSEVLVEEDEFGPIFDALADRDDTLSVKTFHDILHEIGLNPTEKEIVDLLMTIGLDMESHINKEQFTTLMHENESHNASLQEAAFQSDSTPLSRKMSRKNTEMGAAKNKKGHSDMYWIDFTKEEWPEFPKGFELDEQNRVDGFSGPTTLRDGFVGPEVEDILLMIDQKGVDKRLNPTDICDVIRTRLQTNGATHLKFRRHVNHDNYTGEYFVAFHAVPNVGQVEDNVVVGPIDQQSAAYHEGIRHGDLVLSINNEYLSGKDVEGLQLDTSQFQAMCSTALLRDGSLTLHLEHSEHRAEHHRDILHPTVHEGMRFLCGGGCCDTKQRGSEGKYSDSVGGAKSYADAV